MEISSDESLKEKVEIGLIGCGDMGLLYLRSFLNAGFKRLNVCDLPSKYEDLKQQFKDSPVQVFLNGFGVVRQSDFIIYSVETSLIDSVVSTYGPATKMGAIVCGQTSVKEPEIQAFEKHLPLDTHIVTCHSLHGPKVNPKGQPMVMIRHRATDEAYNLAHSILSSLNSSMVYLSYQEHDQITADTQAVTHLAFLSMGTAWKTRSTFPWENNRYLGGIDNVKILMALRIYGSKWHVYAGLAMMNPNAKLQVEQYAKSVRELFMLMIQERHEEFKHRIESAARFVFGQDKRTPILLSDSILEQFSLGMIPAEQQKPNSHLSLLAMVDCWFTLGIQPFKHLICQTPPFRLLLGITEYLFSQPELLTRAINAALTCKEIRADDCEFYTAATGWADMIKYGNMEGYKKRFEETCLFFKDRLAEAGKV